MRKAISEFTRIALSQAMSSALRGRTEPEPTDWKSITTMFLSGVNGRQYGYIDGDDNLQRTTEAAVDGYNVYSTIDATIQGIVEKYLKKI